MRPSIPTNHDELYSNFEFVSDFEFRISNLTPHQLQFPSRRNLFAVNQLSSLVYILSHNAYSDFRNTLRSNLNPDRTSNALKFFTCCNHFLFEMFEDRP